MKIKLSSSVHDALWGDATLFPHPLYTKAAKEKRENEDWKYVAIWVTPEIFMGRYTHIPTYNFDGIENIYGSYYIQFYKTDEGYWLISFKTQSILQNKYLKMTDEEMLKVLTHRIDY